MDFETRRGIARGVWVAIAGLVIAFVVTPILSKILGPAPEDIISNFGGGDPFATIEKMQSTSDFLSVTFYGGLLITLLGVLYSAVVWTKWFTNSHDEGPQDKNG